MASGKLDPSKKRVSLSLKKKTVAEFQAITKELGFTSSIMSAICEEALVRTTATFKKAKEKGQLSMSDLFHMIAEEVESIEKSERK